MKPNNRKGNIYNTFNRHLYGVSTWTLSIYGKAVGLDDIGPKLLKSLCVPLQGFCVVLLVAVGTWTTGVTARPPHVIFIVADDLGKPI